LKICIAYKTKFGDERQDPLTYPDLQFSDSYSRQNEQYQNSFQEDEALAAFMKDNQRAISNNLFVHGNLFHDILYEYGFTPFTGNHEHERAAGQRSGIRDSILISVHERDIPGYAVAMVSKSCYSLSQRVN
jgi:hypothetical protein